MIVCNNISNKTQHGPAPRAAFRASPGTTDVARAGGWAPAESGRLRAFIRARCFPTSARFSDMLSRDLPGAGLTDTSESDAFRGVEEHPQRMHISLASRAIASFVPRLTCLVGAGGLKRHLVADKWCQH